MMDKDKHNSEERAWQARQDTGPNGGRPHRAENGAGNLAVDPWTLTEAVLRRWYWIFLVVGVLAGAAYYIAEQRWHNTYTASVQLIRFEMPNSTEFYKPRQLTDATFASLLKAPELLKRIAAKAKPSISPEALTKRSLISPTRDSDVVVVMVGGMDLRHTLDLANLYAREAAQYTRELQAKEAGEVNEALKTQLAQLDADLAAQKKDLATAPSSTQKAGHRTSQTADQLETARGELVKLLSQYTDLHPLVQRQRAQVQALEKQLTDAANAADKAASEPAKGKKASEEDSDVLRGQLQTMANNRLLLANRQREAQMYVDNPPGYCKVFAPATEKDVRVKKSEPKVMFATAAAGLVGFFASLFLVLLVELLDSRLKTPRDVNRVTNLPVLATLGDLNEMTPAEQRSWAFRTWTAIQGQLSTSPNHGLVCGVTSASQKEGRSTWVNMLAQAASECGFRVLTVATLSPNSPAEAARLHGPNGRPHGTIEDGENTALTTNVLSTPMEVTQQLTGDDPQPMVHIPLPGWVWNLERRKQWQAALRQWRSIENIVILVELPPATQPEAVLLAQNLPNLIWLSDSGAVHAGPTRDHLQTLRDARCNLVGSVLNHAPRGLKNRFSRWTTAFAVLLGFAVADLKAQGQPVQPPAAPPVVAAPAAGQAAPPNAVPTPGAPQVQPAAIIAETNLAFSGAAAGRRAAWQQKFTLGPGDVLNFGLFGQPEQARTEVPVGPDGRVSYLQATDIVATGLTVDELRAKIEEELGKYYRSPRVLITPVAYNSKKYYVLGKVMNRGVFPLDRPVTIVEAVARAKGLETGILDNQNSVDLVDLQHSFLMRDGKRLPVDLERLFQQGDLSQNIGLQPDDYLYFAPGALKEVYVLGEIRLPGPLTWTENTTVIRAIAGRGGFTERAYKSRVVVVRGSLNAPQTYVVDTLATVDARALDFKLAPKDIVYISWRPFIKAEELLDLAATAFIQSAVAAWAGQNVGPFISSPILPSL